MVSIPIIVVNWNGKAFLPDCLEALSQQRCTSCHVILVDNGSTDGSAEVVRRQYPNISIIELPTNRGFAAANNLAIKAVRAPYVALINNDAVAHPVWLESLLKALEEYPEAGFAASKMLFHDDPDTIDRAGDAYTIAGAGRLRGRGERADRYNDREFIFGACAGAALYRTRMLAEIGLFDEDFFLLYEDIDLSFRAQLQGYRCVYVPEAKVLHKASRSIIRDSPLSVYYGHRNLEWVYFKNMPVRLILKTILPHIMYDLAAFYYFSARGRVRDYVRAKKDAAKAMGKTLRKRQKIQGQRKVENDYLWHLMTREGLFARLKARVRS